MVIVSRAIEEIMSTLKKNSNLEIAKNVLDK